MIRLWGTPIEILIQSILNIFSSFWRRHQGRLDSWAKALAHDRRGEQAEEWTGKPWILFFNVNVSSGAIALFARLQVVVPNWICALPKLNLVEANPPTSWKFCSGKGTRGAREGAVPQVPRQVHRGKLPEEGRTDEALENIPLRILRSKGMFGFNLVKMEEKVREIWPVIEFAFSDPWKRPSRQWDSPLEKGNASQKGRSS